MIAAHFGGPDAPPGRLRDLLAARIAAVPAGGSIDWVSYYLGDDSIAQALVEARRRGVEVRVTLDKTPRIAAANAKVLRMLGHPGALGDALRRAGRRIPLLGRAPWSARLHTKIYCFSHPRPSAFIGTYNPLGPEGMARGIGDHDRGDNLLIELDDPTLVEGLRAHAGRLHRTRPGAMARFQPVNNQILESADTQIHFWPRSAPNPIDQLLGTLGRSARVRVVASHLMGPGTARPLVRLARLGADVRVFSSATSRRVSRRAVQGLQQEGVHVRQVAEPDGEVMHLKFILVEDASRRVAVTGSYNWTFRSRWLNDEVAAISRDAHLWDALADRWERLERRPTVTV